jgi:ribulose-5-phosphate 4-epimerase/fuculose-1-phosphate aldolase
MMDLDALVRISRYAGERFDLIQAGGGNSSVKTDQGHLYIKSSGVLLSELSNRFGFTILDLKKTRSIFENKDIHEAESKELREKFCNGLVNSSVINESRPSIETLFHTLFFKYTLHTHPLSVTFITSLFDWQERLRVLFKDYEILLIPYETPGIELALSIKNNLSALDEIPKIVFLQNHGLIVSSNNENDIYSITELVVKRIENDLGLDFNKYRLVTDLSKRLNNLNSGENILYLTEDYHIRHVVENKFSLFLEPPFFPDSLVFCGYKAVELYDLDDLSPIVNYMKEFGTLPKILIYNFQVYIVAISIKKAREIEEVLKMKCILLDQIESDKINFLRAEELNYLNNWEAEKFRQQI